MQYRYISVVITLIAGLIACISCIIGKYDVIYSLKVILAVLVIFFIIGTIAKKTIFSVLNKPQEEEEYTDDIDIETSSEEVENDAGNH